MKNSVYILLLGFLFLDLTSCKIYERCQLARELKNVHRLPASQLATWVCIAKHESNFDTRAIGKPNELDDRDYGIFQINNRYWCFPQGRGCSISCSSLRNDNINDDVRCAKKIYEKTRKIMGDGFKAWAVYEKHCIGPQVKEYLNDCF